MDRLITVGQIYNRQINRLQIEKQILEGQMTPYGHGQIYLTYGQMDKYITYRQMDPRQKYIYIRQIDRQIPNKQICTKCTTLRNTFRSVPIRQISRFSNNTLFSINLSTTLSVFSGICLTGYNSIQSVRFISNTIVNINPYTTQSSFSWYLCFRIQLVLTLSWKLNLYQSRCCCILQVFMFQDTIQSLSLIQEA